MKNNILLIKLLDIPNCEREIKILFSEQFHPVNFLKGQIIIGSNIPNQSLYFVADGLLRRYSIRKELDITNQLYISGDFISQNRPHLKSPNAEYIQCLNNVQLMYINHNQIEEFLRKEPAAIELLFYIADEQKIKEAENSEMLHVEVALERYRLALTLIGQQIHQVSKSILASYLRISRRQLGRILVEFSKK